MGISGLLPALKPIQKTKHLSEYSGKTIAVDAYVWLHKAVFSCATELATGRTTNKHVKYAMERVRLLRHYGIDPYIVFDGGPLPAKRGTEVERQLKREDNLKKGNALAAQGRHSQAREFYTKAVDVSPKMAFQFIKALRAESVQYVVAPYEADAQLAYLERVGLVDGILTEDSDLLVFGCKNVLFKLDPVASTVVSISRSDFGSITATTSDISLVGWSDLQFRRMAILSGCDYIPSVPGIGLKTACTLLRKWKTVDQVVRVLMLEGKKNVPRGYLENFLLAEKCFLHQRVFDPTQEKLVHLTDVDEEAWDEQADTYVGEDMDPSLAHRIALGDVDPISKLPIEDTEELAPRILREIPMNKGKAVVSPVEKSKGGLHDFWGPTPKIPPRPKVTAGKASGKRRLVDVMDHDIAVKKKKHEPEQSSKFFAAPVAGPSRIPDENEPPDIEDVDVASLVAQRDPEDHVMGLFKEDLMHVEQEDGYITPQEDECAVDVSSPGRNDRDGILSSPASQRGDLDDADALSSPVRHRQRSRSPSCHLINTPCRAPTTTQRQAALDLTSEIDIFEGDQDDSILFYEEEEEENKGPSPTPPSAEEELEDPEERVSREQVIRTEAVAAGWRQRWSLGGGSISALKRRETNVTPMGRHKIASVSKSAPQLARSASLSMSRSRPSTPKLLFHETVNSKSSSTCRTEEGGRSQETPRQSKLAQFRCPV